MPGTGVASTKHLLDRSPAMALDEALEEEAEAQLTALAAPEYEQALRRLPGAQIGAEMTTTDTATTTLRSFIMDEWYAPANGGKPLHDAVTGEEIALISSDGIDMAGRAGLRPARRRNRAAAHDLPRARADAEAHG